MSSPRELLRLLRAPAVVVALALAGCQSGQIPDPNDPKDVGLVQPEVLRSSLEGVAESLSERYLRREITREQFDALMEQYANELLSDAKLDDVPPERVWEYAEVFRTAKRWREAQALLKVAVANAKNEDRRVNDSLRLAQTQAQLGQVAEAIETARSVFNTPPQEKAPILTSVLLEIVPAGQGKNFDFELAELLEDAIDQSRQTIVDEKTEAGQSFLLARPHHIRSAWRLVVQLYEQAGRSDRAQRAIERESEMLRNSGSA